MVLRVDIEAAGAVVTRKSGGNAEILLVHRPKYDDWSFPKGKLDPGEHVVTAAVREVAEETGLDIRLGNPLPPQYYSVFPGGRERTKRVHYWVGRLVGGDDVAHFKPNSEVDVIGWYPLDAARKKLTYPHDRRTLDDFRLFRKKSHPLIVLRHSKARSRKSWRGDDRERPLTLLGEYQAEQLVPLIGAYGVTRVVSSTSRRCWSTIAPYADVADLEIEDTKDLSEEDASEEAVASLVTELMDGKEPAVLCTHRPVLPWAMAAAGAENVFLEPGAFLVIHHRKRKVVAVEQHVPPSGR